MKQIVYVVKRGNEVEQIYSREIYAKAYIDKFSGKENYHNLKIEEHEIDKIFKGADPCLFCTHTLECCGCPEKREYEQRKLIKKGVKNG